MAEGVAAGAAPPVPMRLRIRSAVDGMFFKGAWTPILWLGVFAILIVIAAACLLVVTGIGPEAEGSSILEDLWITLTRALDPGTIAADEGWSFRLVSVAVALAGVLILSALFGLMTSSVERQVAELRRGKAPVAVRGHTVILGWSPKVATIVAELAIANENQGRSHLVVLAPRDKVEMEQEIRSRVPRLATTRVHFRSGDPASPVDLAIVNPGGARSVIVVAGDDDLSDAVTIKSCLAVLAMDGMEQVPVVAELADTGRAAALRAATHGRVTTVVSSDVVARIAARVCRHHGLSEVFQELLDFDGDEIYLRPVGPELAGETFATSALSFSTSTVIGVLDEDGAVHLCPPNDRTLRAGEHLVAISEDDDTVVLDEVLTRPTARHGVEVPPAEHGERDGQVLVVGWSELGPKVVASMVPYLGPGSSVRVLHDPTLISSTDIVRPEIPREVPFEVVAGDTTDPATLRAAIEDSDVDHVLILCYRSGLHPSDADARALLTLMLVRSALAAAGDGDVSVVTELLDVRDVELAGNGGVEDFVVSERLTSLLLAQLSEDLRLEAIFAQLLDSAGVELAMRSVGDGVGGEPVSVRDLAAAVAGSSEILIGFCHAVDGGGNRVVVNPSKHREVRLAEDHHLIVLRAQPHRVEHRTEGVPRVATGS